MNSSSASIIATGNAGLDQVLRGGLPKDRLYLLEGTPGSGKTTLGLQFLFEGVRQGESVLYITLSETSEELRCVAESHGWSLDGVHLFELSAADAVLGGAQEQTILHPWESELGDTIELIQARVDELQPRRLVFDSLSEMRLLAQDPLRYRRQVLALKQFFAGRGLTVLLVDDLTASGGERDNHLHSLCHGVLTLERLTLDFGAARRRLQIQKLRGVDFIAGYHDFVLRRGGLEIYPRMIAAGRYQDFVGQPVPSNIADMDALLHGGPLRGTSTLITGPAGTGKTTLALQYVTAACARGERCAVYEFDERIGTLLKRAESMGMPLHRYIDEGLLVVHQIDPAELSPGEFAWRVRRDVDENDCRLLVMDSLNGYLAAMPQEQHLILQMHELLSYLSQSGVVTFLINPQHGLVGTMTSSLDISYIADTVVLIRFFEAQGRLRKAISILKHRGGGHEDAIRELRIDTRGIRVGQPLVDFRGVLTGTPEYFGAKQPLMEERD
ncbi:MULTISPECIES: ATPase domain-containing protein [Pseudomonadaceae]|uniref:non-specific serine/threonine protein kinase n=1 Tax=Pseudomonas oryzihabitans TaxID=47885 RepID=A0ABX3IK81_9PSED|nr:MULTISPECIES: ATPase domain-containing protein [Pseudomonas]MBA1183045.1 AAA family ATPase [Pseudomonas psychrotolerans]MBA1213618.1 AAA family ATPase [Pseudomonas psychrotolerans]ONN68727.1 circadian clock protein KaiC [Pseudomonas psychrotolerans]QEU02737.1 AAA family ATPase [Pseudomonas oryzihabitans]TCQ84146.1 circadian clock protein KaiC [Pseudomonas sp. JUb52]